MDYAHTHTHTHTCARAYTHTRARALTLTHIVGNSFTGSGHARWVHGPGEGFICIEIKRDTFIATASGHKRPYQADLSTGWSFLKSSSTSVTTSLENAFTAVYVTCSEPKLFLLELKIHRGVDFSSNRFFCVLCVVFGNLVYHILCNKSDRNIASLV